MPDRPTIPSARAAAARALCDGECPNSPASCGACQHDADRAVAAFLQHLAAGPPQFLPDAAGVPSIWINPAALRRMAEALA